MWTLFLVDGIVTPDDIRAHQSQDRAAAVKFHSVNTTNQPPLLRPQIKAAIFPPMHFSRHISQSHSTFSLLAALKLRSRAN
jgi:hypothetical protein